MIELSDNAKEILEKRYLRKDEEGNIIENEEEMFWRVAGAMAAVELNRELEKEWGEKFYIVMSNLDFLPNSPALRNLGNKSGIGVACFVIPIEDSRQSIFAALQAAVEVNSWGGGVGYDFSSLRPKGSLISTTKGCSSGPVSFMKIFDLTIGEIIAQSGVRHGAQMGVMRCDHPDIYEFIKSKTEEGQLKNFNISVAITDEFMGKVLEEKPFDWDLKFNDKIYQTIDGLQLWNDLIYSAWSNGEPGILFIDVINRLNPLNKWQTIRSTNPCILGDTLLFDEDHLQRVDNNE